MRRLFKINKNNLRQVRHARVRTHLKGTAECPRLSVFRSLRGIVAQLVDDNSGKTICSAKSSAIKSEPVEGKTGKVAQSFLVGKQLATEAKAKNITTVVFDRGGYKFHGRVAAVAEGAQAGGLKL
ncbi:MAG: 50S ribosomal protein L18 [Candidatus Magasanikbacteria bacterium GW2011_GWC2_34_16]|uniref:Large ribosomal subunit protein uL18 n=2 Tax=Candidatus Magasanikiibacteriota TaxID=1752731 RepID=A0A0G0HAY2_9BACT|nr:MAG: 50S ribosomal protein L18 [Candidatus Magasanikbacteria bacterium GW2011_GWC2_34_16]KKQ39297.1 MAG: 50S ribosomal protein L18 [Candidatus Magasanikbacteria bacterium GW2011_GWA2_37_8]